MSPFVSAKRYSARRLRRNYAGFGDAVRKQLTASSNREISKTASKPA